MEKRTTYMDHIERMRLSIINAYNLAGALRDSGTGIEKDHYNKMRGLLNDACNEADKLINNVNAAGRADMTL
jgi:hypothetical protein